MTKERKQTVMPTKVTPEQLEEIRRSLTPSQLIDLCHKKAIINERKRKAGIPINESVDAIPSVQDNLLKFMDEDERKSFTKVLTMFNLAVGKGNGRVIDIIIEEWSDACKRIEEKLDLRDEGHGEDPERIE